MSTDAPVRPAPPVVGLAGGRDRFLDLLRMISVLRVVALHTCTKPPLVYLPWIQWIFPGMPEVFFVSGAVTAAALEKRPWRTVVGSRFRRLLPPFYVYAFVALGVMAVTDLRSSSAAASLDRGDFGSFLVPLVRPTGSETRVVLWGHLWFLTAFLWVIGLSPLTYALHKRVRAWSLLLPGVLFFAVVAWEKLGHQAVREELYHVTMFGFFFQLGYLYRDGTIQRLSPRVHAALAAALGFAGWLVAMVFEPVWRKPVNELYSSQTGHLLIGAAWMFAMFAVRAPLKAWLDSRRSARALETVNQRNYTIFLWGPAANAVAMAASRRVAGDTGNLPLYLLATSATLVGLVGAFGWIEDVAIKRKARLIPWGEDPPRASGASAAPGAAAASRRA